MDRNTYLEGMCSSKKEKNRKGTSLTITFLLIFMAFIGMLGTVIGPEGQQHNIWGTASEGVLYPGAGVPDGSEITAWIDGVTYGNTITTATFFDLYIEGDDWGYPDNDYVKDGGYDGDAIVYFLNYNPMDYYLNVSHTTSSFNPAIYENVDPLFFNRTDQAPGWTTLRMLKINEIVLDPIDGLSQYVIVYDPGQNLGMNYITDYYLQKDNNVTHSPEGETFDFLIHASDIVDMSNGYYYINLTADLELNNTDELKLVWRSPYAPNPNPALTGPGNGIDIIVDRVEWGNYTNYINPATPPDDRDYDNTTLLDFIEVASLYGTGAGMIRTDDKFSPGYSGNGTDTDNCLADFKVLGQCTPRPQQPGYPVHNIDTDEYFYTIQAAIDDSDTQDGHIIEVVVGTYYENVVVHKAINLTGEDRDNTIIDGGGQGNTCDVTADFVKISGFTITNSGSESGPTHDSGINIGTNHNNIFHNRIITNCYGILIGGSNHNIIESNLISNNQWGIRVNSSSNNSVLINNVSSNNNGGIWVDFSDNTTISNNNIRNNSWGLWLSYSHDNLVYHNNFIRNADQAFDSTDSGNQWDNGYPSGGNFWSDYTGIDEYSGPNQDMIGNDGIGDTNRSIDNDSVDNYPLRSPNGNFLYLYEGWNLISIPFFQVDTNVGIILSQITGLFDAVQWLDSSDSNDRWKHNITSKPAYLNDLDSFDHTCTIWIHITGPDGAIFEYPGTRPVSNQTIQIHPGWNMVGYPSLTSYNRTMALNNLNFGTDIDGIWSYNAAGERWEEMDEQDSFYPGQGYWVHSNVTKVWDVPL